jgi:hypothetical protein
MSNIKLRTDEYTTTQGTEEVWCDRDSRLGRNTPAVKSGACGADRQRTGRGAKNHKGLRGRRSEIIVEGGGNGTCPPRRGGDGARVMNQEQATNDRPPPGTTRGARTRTQVPRVRRSARKIRESRGAREASSAEAPGVWRREDDS